MGEIARRQGVDRWAECTPTNRLDLDRIERCSIDSVGRPNRSFGEEEEFAPVGRWRDVAHGTRQEIEEHIGDLLYDLDYEVGSLGRVGVGTRLRRFVYERSQTFAEN